MSDELIGQHVLRRYRIVQSLGQGGMGVVYLARTEGAAGFSRPVVVKSILPHLLERSDMADMFVREARILSNLSHPGIVRVLDFGREGQRYLMVLEYVNGYDLGRFRRFLAKTQRKFPVNIAVHVICQVLAALQYAHTARRGDGTSLKTVHRDVSPSNILLSDEGQVRLVDFGIASVVTERGEHTKTGGFRGKFIYAAPELLQGGAPTPQSDIYSAALVLYQLIAGKNPFNAPTDSEIIQRVSALELPSLRAARPDTSAHLEALVRMGLSRDPKQRFESAAHFADALRRTQDVADEQLRQLLAERLRMDFYGDLPEVMKTERLEARDEAWRFASIPSKPASGRPETTHSPPPGDPNATVVQGGSKPPLKLPVLSGRQRRQRRLLGYCAPVIGGAAVLGWWFWPTPTPAEDEREPPNLTASSVIDHAALDRVSPAPKRDPVDAAHAVDPLSDEQETPLPPSQALGLANTVSKHAMFFADCFNQHGLSAPPADVRLGFRVSADGKVQTVTLVPAELASTEFGKCVAVQYRAITFGAQGRNLRFYIPIRLSDVLSFERQ